MEFTDMVALERYVDKLTRYYKANPRMSHNTYVRKIYTRDPDTGEQSILVMFNMDKKSWIWPGKPLGGEAPLW